MLEASFILSEEGVSWLTGEGAQYVEGMAVSRALVGEMQQRDSGALSWFGELDSDRLGTLAEVLGRAQLFSHEQIGEVGEGAGAVRSRLFAEHDQRTAEILADEWIFLQTQSWIGAKSRKAFDAFKAAGGRLRELPSPIARRLIAKTLKKEELPEHIPLKLLRKAGMKWIAVSGTAATYFVAPPVAAALTFGTGAFVLLDP